MISSSRQLKDKIRNLAKSRSLDAQLLLRHYMMERFLERIAASSYSGALILKGGMLVTSMVGYEARSTMDIDATMRGVPVTKDGIQRIVEEIISIDLSDGVHFSVDTVSDIMGEAKYSGVRLGLTAVMDGIRVHLKVDISTGDVITPRAVEYSYKLMFEPRSIRLLAYNLETLLAEKLETVITRATANTRMRDFYDIHVLSSLYSSEIDNATLAAALKATAHNRGSLNRLNDAEEILMGLHDDRNMRALWDDYRKKFDFAATIPWSTVLRSVRTLAIDADLEVKKPSVLEQLQEPVREEKNSAGCQKSNDIER